MKLAVPKPNGAPIPHDPASDQQVAAALRHFSRAPYWYDEMPPAGVPFFVPGSIPSPNYGVANQKVVASYQCPSNFVAVLKGILQVFDGTGPFINGSGSIIWTIDVDLPIPAVAGTVGYQFDGYGNLLTQMGSYQNGLWKVYPGLRFADGETVRYKVQTVNTVGQGAPNFVTCMLAGWICPVHLANL